MSIQIISSICRSESGLGVKLTFRSMMSPIFTAVAANLLWKCAHSVGYLAPYMELSDAVFYVFLSLSAEITQRYETNCYIPLINSSLIWSADKVQVQHERSLQELKVKSVEVPENATTWGITG